jgi:hypothetical protein
MRSPNLRNLNLRLGLAAFAALLVLPACSVNVRKEKGGEEQKVDIETPVGGIHVRQQADVRDVGLPVYPGARVKERAEDGQEKSANLNLSALGFGLKVVAIEYESDDPPGKIIAYYQEQLKKYGNVLECRTHGVHEVANQGNSRGSLKCGGDNSGNTVELKVGTEENQHIVSVEPKGKGSDFGLAYVQMHGKDTI